MSENKMLNVPPTTQQLSGGLGRSMDLAGCGVISFLRAAFKVEGMAWLGALTSPPWAARLVR